MKTLLKWIGISTMVLGIISGIIVIIAWKIESPFSSRSISHPLAIPSGVSIMVGSFLQGILFIGLSKILGIVEDKASTSESMAFKESGKLDNNISHKSFDQSSQKYSPFKDEPLLR